MKKEQPKDFLIQPETNASCTIWHKGRAIKVMADSRGRLIISFDDEAWQPPVASTDMICFVPQKSGDAID